MYIFILDKVLVLSHAFYFIYEIHHYAQLASFRRFRLCCVRKKADLINNLNKYIRLFIRLGSLIKHYGETHMRQKEYHGTN